MADCTATATTAALHSPVTLHCATASATTDWIIAGGTVVAAVGTVAAVSFALYQSRRQENADFRVRSAVGIEAVGGGRRARRRLRLVGVNHGPAQIKIVEAALRFVVADGAYNRHDRRANRGRAEGAGARR